jgi:hypothetical protein
MPGGIGDCQRRCQDPRRIQPFERENCGKQARPGGSNIVHNDDAAPPKACLQVRPFADAVRNNPLKDAFQGAGPCVTASAAERSQPKAPSCPHSLAAGPADLTPAIPHRKRVHNDAANPIRNALRDNSRVIDAARQPANGPHGNRHDQRSAASPANPELAAHCVDSPAEQPAEEMAESLVATVLDRENPIGERRLVSAEAGNPVTQLRS